MVSHNSVADSRQASRGAGFSFGDIVGKSPGMNRLFERLPLVAESESPVLISGASGTGKELVAQEIHRRGPRREKPFMAVHCQAVPEDRLEVGLFGRAPDRPGSIARANLGTLFVDEVGYLSPRLQVKLVSFLMDGAYQPVEADKSIRADVRIIAATKRDLGALAAAERAAIARALRLHDGNRTRAAKELGIHRSTLLRKMRRYDL
jgi:DNA-binding NtrC family response regulator